MRTFSFFFFRKPSKTTNSHTMAQQPEVTQLHGDDTITQYINESTREPYAHHGPS